MHTSLRRRLTCSLAAFAAVTFTAAVSSAQNPTAGAPADAPAAPDQAPPQEEEKDGVRFRGGVSASFGGIFGSDDPYSASGIMGGADGRLGLQINNLIGVYAVPHLAFGSVTQEIGPFSASDGWLAFSGTGVVDFTFIDQIFVGAGGGFAAHAPTCTNCNGISGPVIHFRFGGYPLMGKGDDGIRRKGLLLGGDMRINILSGSGVDVVMFQPMVTLGYEAY